MVSWDVWPGEEESVRMEMLISSQSMDILQYGHNIRVGSLLDSCLAFGRFYQSYFLTPYFAKAAFLSL
jgi:hypothetical protein